MKSVNDEMVRGAGLYCDRSAWAGALALVGAVVCVPYICIGVVAGRMVRWLIRRSR